MTYIIEPPEIEEKSRQVEPYLTGANSFKEGTPDYIKEIYEEILDFYRKELDWIHRGV